LTGSFNLATFECGACTRVVQIFCQIFGVTYYRVEKLLYIRAVDMLEVMVAEIAVGKEAEGV